MNGVKAVILAGGLGTRLRPYTLFLPKPMLPLGDRPIIEHIIRWLKGKGVREFVVSIGYMGRVIEDYFGDGSSLGVSMKYVRSDRPMGTAGQLKLVEDLIDGTFICVYGDSIFKFDLDEAIRFHKEKGCLATIMVKKYVERLKYGLIEFDDGHLVRSWREKPEITGFINSGCYLMEPGFLKYIPKGRVFGMDKAFKRALEAGERIGAFEIEDFMDIGNKDAYKKAYLRYLKELGEIP